MPGTSSPCAAGAHDPVHDHVPTPLLRCVGLQVGYGGKALLPPIDLTLSTGEFWAVIGRNGTGKTTWFRTVLGLVPAVAGRVETPRGRPRVSYLAQRSTFDDLYPLRVWEVVATGMDVGWRALGPRWGRPPAVATALAEVGALDLADRTWRSLSEGQKQRVQLARLVASGSCLGVLDEPTAAMDEVAERETLDLLDHLRRVHHMTVVVVSHHLAVARQRADHVLFVDREGPVAVWGPPQEVLRHPTFLRYFGEAA